MMTAQHVQQELQHCVQPDVMREAIAGRSRRHLLALPHAPVAAARVARRALLPRAAALIALRHLPDDRSGWSPQPSAAVRS